MSKTTCSTGWGRNNPACRSAGACDPRTPVHHDERLNSPGSRARKSFDDDRKRRPALRDLTWVLSVALLCCISACTPGPSSRAALALDEREQACASCHADQAVQFAAFSLHRGGPGGVGCLGCHRAHELDGNGRAVGGGFAARCEDCHAEVAAQFRLPIHHRLGPGMSCITCHEPHGSPRHQDLEELRESKCVECHSQYRGPFVFGHDGDDNLRCMSCHEPHGSVQPRMLSYPNSRSLCTSCHSNLDHVLGAGSQFNECLNCHTEVHGSNWDSRLLR